MAGLSKKACFYNQKGGASSATAISGPPGGGGGGGSKINDTIAVPAEATASEAITRG